MKFNLFIGTAHEDEVTVYFIAGATGKKLPSMATSHKDVKTPTDI